MDKIYTITIHRAINYGAVLQAYGLHRYLKSQGYDVEIIDYRPKDLEYKKVHLWEYVTLKSLIRYSKVVLKFLIHPKLSGMKVKKFNSFCDKYFISTNKKYNGFKELINESWYGNIFICGSDQIWNSELTNGISKPYYLEFVPTGAKRVAYAASFGKDSIYEKEKPIIRGLISKFDAISIREDSGIEIAKQLGIAATKVLDPAFLLTKDEWSKIANIPKYKNYLLIYKFGDEDIIEETYKKIAEKLKLKTVLISESMTGEKKVDFKANGTGPEEFLGLFMFADFIVTNTFHGTAFSIIFEKNFVSVSHSDTDTRMTSLLDSLGIFDRFIKQREDIDSISNSIDYIKVKQLLDKQKQQSFDFIEEVLK
ncbi:MAG: polysaccharide pyruvyl transferase family protein [Candidatus Delongbacteria bacterium]|nr:polysaccharide pyruvyl transferase family protein [Candidatus Delongbacteria bacterium]